MLAVPDSPRLTPQEYFEWEAAQELRYEYFDGKVYAMTGGSLAHADIALNVATILRSHVNSRCKVRNSDAKVGISADGPFTYPDVSVSCESSDRAASQYIQHPCLIVEVLSPGTEAYDRGGKFALYRRLDSLQEYVLVESEKQGVELFRRGSGGIWEFTTYAPGSVIDLHSLGLQVAINEFYADVTFPTG